MINANELRIGNWVEENVLGRAKISLISDPSTCCLSVKHMDVDRKVTDVDYTIHLSEIKPIPLTPELLVKCGAEEQTSPKESCNFKIKITEDGWQIGLEETDNWDAWYGKEEHWEDRLPLCSFKSLHQLQNLYFALCGKELEITNL